MRKSAWMLCGGIAILVGCGTETTTVVTGGNTSGTPVATPSLPAHVEAPVDPMCRDGDMYAETLPAATADLQDLVSAYRSDQAMSFASQVLARRYPLGQQLVTEGLANCARFLTHTATAANVFSDLGTLVHECGHAADWARSGFSNDTGSFVSAYVITPSLTLEAADGDSRYGLAFPRGEILTDGYQDSLTPCVGTSSSATCDFFAVQYLGGDDYTLGRTSTMGYMMGNQGFDTLLEELVQYTNSLAVGMAFADQRTPGMATNSRDGVLTFLWYVERYLHLARTSYPATYNHLLTGDAGRWREAVLTAWGRAWHFLDASESDGGLGMYEDNIAPLVMDPVLLGEIERLRITEGCP